MATKMMMIILGRMMMMIAKLTITTICLMMVMMMTMMVMMIRMRMMEMAMLASIMMVTVSTSALPSLSPLHLNPHQLEKLSLWARVNIIYGQETDFDNLSRDDVDVCLLKSPAVEKPVELTTKIRFEEWGKSLLRRLHHELNEEGVSLAYVLRGSTMPTKFTPLHEQLEYLLPLKVSDAKFRCDAHRIFTMIEGLVKNESIRPLLEKYRIGTGTEGFCNGRACFFGLKEYHQVHSRRMSSFLKLNTPQKQFTGQTQLSSLLKITQCSSLIVLISSMSMVHRGLRMRRTATFMQHGIKNRIPYLPSFG